MKEISRFSKSLALAAPVVAMATDPMEAAIYAKFDGVDGESKDEAFDGYVKLSYFKVEIEGVTQAAGASIKDFKISLPMEKASPSLMLACATGQVLKDASIVVTRSNGDGAEVPFLMYKLTNVLVTSYSTGGGGENTAPSEEVSLNFEKIVWTYIVRDSDGKETERIVSPEIPKEGPR